MDKFKIYLAIVNKYQFWIISGLMLVTALVCWWLATGSLADQFSQRKIKIDQAFNSIKLPPNPPNQAVIDKIKKQHHLVQASVLDTQEILYREQKENNHLPNVLSKDFKQQFENLKPNEELKRTYLEEYQTFIPKHLPTLREGIDALRPAGNKTGAGAVRPERKPAAGPAPAAGGSGNRSADGSEHDAAGEVEWIGTVDWDSASYNALVHQFESMETSSTLAVLLAQEDLWVYEALLRVIKNTNDGATGHATAPVKRIEALEIGKAAAKAWKDTAGNFLSTGQTKGSLAAPAPAGATSASGEDRNRQELVEGRYVDDKGEPLSYDAQSPYYAKHPYKEFKMMPIRMKLVMDQRRLPKLLVECANSNMPIEVQRLFFLKGQGGAGDGGAGSGHASDTAATKDQEGGPQPPSYLREPGPSDITVEIRGLIYIYNPPTRAEPGIGAASIEKPAEATAPAAPTAAAPAAPPAASSAPAPATAPAAPPATAPAAAPTATAPPAAAPAKPPKP